MDKLNLLKLFLAVVDQGNFATAASALGLSPSTVSKAISRLETDLQLYLFHRTTRQLTLTEAGKAYVDTVRRVMNDLDLCEAMLGQSNDEPKGLLKVNLPVSYGRSYILPLIAGFHRQYPEITLDLSFNDAYVDMIEQGVDVCIRSGTLEPSGLIARQLSPIDFLICAAPTYLKAYNRITYNDFHQHPWIRFRYRQTGRLMPIMITSNGQQHDLNPGTQFVVDDGEALADLCAQGLGLTQVPHFIARDWLQRQDIVTISPFYRPKGFGVWAIYAKRNFLPSKIRVFVNYLEESVRASGETTYSTWVEDLSILFSDDKTE